MEVLDIIKDRRSIRKYKDKQVPKEIIEDIIDAGRMAPTANNIQPWEFVVVTDYEVRKKLANIATYGRFIEQAPVCVIVCCKDTKYYLEDGCAATENIMLAAKAHGLGSCWVAGDKKPYLDEIKELIGAPKDIKIISLIPIGYPDGEPKLRKRNLSEVLHWEKY